MASLGFRQLDKRTVISDSVRNFFTKLSPRIRHAPVIRIENEYAPVVIEELCLTEQPSDKSHYQRDGAHKKNSPGYAPLARQLGNSKVEERNMNWEIKSSASTKLALCYSWCDEFEANL